jgi:REP element-mobilizing transposase RayT
MKRKPETIAFWRGNLPHWEVVDGRYFVTIHLQGAIPANGQERIRQIAQALDTAAKCNDEVRLRLQRRIFAEMETWLDRAEHNTHLRDPKVAKIVMDAIAFRQGRDWNMFEFVVMPSHVHLLFEVASGVSEDGRLKSILEQFKRWTGHEAVKLLGMKDQRFWQDEWFDHWSRSDEEDERIVAYIRRNPVKAGLVTDYLQWPFGSWAINTGR